LLTVYVLGPVAGGLLAGLVFTRIVEPMMNGKPCENCE